MLFEDIMSIMNIDGNYNNIQSNSNNNVDTNKIIKSMKNVVKDIGTNKLNND